MSDGCAACGALPVGPPLARPERELPSYGYAFASVAAGLLLVAALLAAFVTSLLKFETLDFEPHMLLRAAERAAWRLKWTALPFSLVAVWATARFCRKVGREPSRFAGLRLVRAGFGATATVAAAIALLIGVTIPERLEQRELGLRAAENAQLYASAQVLSEYHKRFGSLPATTADLRKLDDPSCTFAPVIALMDTGEYKPETDLASLAPPRSKGSKAVRPARVRNVSARSTDDLPDSNLSLTNYELVLPGRDKILGTEDDLRIRDGLILAAPKEGGAAPAKTTAKKN